MKRLAPTVPRSTTTGDRGACWNPAAIVQRLNGEVQKFLGQKDVQERLDPMALISRPVDRSGWRRSSLTTTAAGSGWWSMPD